MTTIPLNKTQLRKAMIAQRQAMPMTEWHTRSRQICDRLRSTPLLNQAHTVLAYCSIRQEPDVMPLLMAQVGTGDTHNPHSPARRWGLPRCVGDQLQWHHWVPGTGLQPGAFGIPEPDPDSPSLQPQEVDLILVPCVACDRQGYRLGYGGGYYDRLLSHPDWHGIPTIGITFAFAHCPSLPIDPWDRPLEAICTETGLYPVPRSA